MNSQAVLLLLLIKKITRTILRNETIKNILFKILRKTATSSTFGYSNITRKQLINVIIIIIISDELNRIDFGFLKQTYLIPTNY